MTAVLIILAWINATACGLCVEHNRLGWAAFNALAAIICSLSALMEVFSNG